MSKQAEAAAEKIWRECASGYWDESFLPLVAERVDAAFAKRERAVAELVAAARARQRCTFGAAGCVKCNTRRQHD